MKALRSFVLFACVASANVLPAFGAAFEPPVAIVYPLTLAGALTAKEAGSDVAIILATKIAEAGGVTVRPYTPGTERGQYLEAALKAKADYYVTGFLQPIGADVSMILQVVSTHSGSVVFSNTATIRTYADALTEAEPLREAILRHAGRGLAALDSPQSQPSATAAPSAGQGVNLTRALGKHTQATPTQTATPPSDAGLIPVARIDRAIPSVSPSSSGTATSPAQSGREHVPVSAETLSAPPSVTSPPTASPTPTRASLPVVAPNAGTTSSTLILDTAGGESPQDRLNASTELLMALRRSGIRAARLALDASETMKGAADICRANIGATRYYAPTLTLGHDEKAQPVAEISVTVIDCTGTIVAQRDASATARARAGTLAAIQAAAAKLTPLLTGV